MNLKVALLLLLFATNVDISKSQEIEPFQNCTVKVLNRDSLIRSAGYPLIPRALGIGGVCTFEIMVDQEGKLASYTCNDPLPIITPYYEKYLSSLRFSVENCDPLKTSYQINIPFSFINELGQLTADYYRQGLIHQISEDHESAIQYFSKEIEFNGLFQVHAYIQRAISYSKINNYAQAIQDLQKVLTKKDDYVQQWIEETSNSLFENKAIHLLSDETVFLSEQKAINHLATTNNKEFNSLLDKVKKEYGFY